MREIGKILAIFPFEFDCALEFGNRFRPFTLSFVSPAQVIAQHPKVSAYLNSAAQFFSGPVVLSHQVVSKSEECISFLRQRIDLYCFLSFSYSLVRSTLSCQKPGIKTVRSQIIWVKLDCAAIFLFCIREISFVPVGYCRQGQMRIAQ